MYRKLFSRFISVILGICFEFHIGGLEASSPVFNVQVSSYSPNSYGGPVWKVTVRAGTSTSIFLFNPGPNTLICSISLGEKWSCRLKRVIKLF